LTAKKAEAFTFLFLVMAGYMVVSKMGDIVFFDDCGSYQKLFLMYQPTPYPDLILFNFRK